MTKRRGKGRFTGGRYEFYPVTEEDARNLRGDFARYGRHKKEEYKRTEEFMSKLEKEGVKNIEIESTIQINAEDLSEDIYQKTRLEIKKIEQSRTLQVKRQGTKFKFRKNKPKKINRGTSVKSSPPQITPVYKEFTSTFFGRRSKRKKR